MLAAAAMAASSGARSPVLAALCTEFSASRLLRAVAAAMRALRPRTTDWMVTAADRRRERVVLVRYRRQPRAIRPVQQANNHVSLKWINCALLSSNPLLCRCLTLCLLQAWGTLLGRDCVMNIGCHVCRLR